MMNRNHFRTHVSIVFFLLLSALVNSQNSAYNDWKILYDKGVEAIDKRGFENAKTYLEEAYKISEKFTDLYIESKGDTQFSLGKSYVALRMYEEAFPILEQSVLLTEKSKGKLDVSYGDRTSYLGSVYDEATIYDEALKYYKAALNSMKANGKDKDTLYAAKLGSVGNIYRIKGEFDLAEKTLEESLNIIKNNVGTNHLDYGTTLSILSMVYKNKGQFDKAISTVQDAIQIIKMNVGDQDPIYASSITNLTQIYSEIGAYEKAIVMQKEIVKIGDSTYKTTDNYAGALFTLSMLYHETDDYDKEIAILEQVRDILPEKNRNQSAVDNNLSQAYDRMGNYEKALVYAQQSFSKTPQNHLSYGIRMQNLAFLYVKLGEFQKGLETYDIALESIEKQYGKNHQLYGMVLNNLGKLQFRLGNFEKAKQLFADALTNFLTNFGENHPKYGYYLNDYAKTLLELGENVEAIELMKANLRLAEKNSNTESEAYFNRQYELAKAYNSLGHFDDALPLLKNATENLKLKLGSDHADYGKMIKTLGDSYVGIGNMEQAYPLMETANEVNYKQLDKIFKFRSENEKKSFLTVMSKSFDDLQSIPLKQPSNNDKWSDLNLNNQLMLKGLLLNNSKDVLTQLETLNDTTIENAIGNYKFLKRQLAKTMSQSADERALNVDSLKEVVNAEESKLVKMHSVKFGTLFNLNKDWKDSQSKLPKNAIGIEFSNFRVNTNGKPSDSVMYVAYLYKENFKHPIMVKLFEEQQLKKVLNQTSPNQLYNSDDLYQLIWKPLQVHIKKSKTIYFSPSGLLNQIQFAAIKQSKSSTFGKKYNLVQLSSTAILAEQPTEPFATETLFIGGIDYDYTNDTISKTVDSVQYAYLDNELLKNKKATRSRGESWTYLPGTLSEINNLQSILKSKGKSYKVLTDKEATETNFKKISGDSPSILHIATHGYFYENLEVENSPHYHLSTEDQYRLAEDPLLRSGLILAGANYTWKNGSNPNEEDGILTAMEISNMDLSNTQMVVLSACETGLGDIDGSEGVYGLQRAFKMAGVEIIVMSLWQVPDAETAEFMNLFYDKWLHGSKVRQAFNDAQRTMQRKYAREPLKWAAFVLFE